jgi:hypothetical protein
MQHLEQTPKPLFAASAFRTLRKASMRSPPNAHRASRDVSEVLHRAVCKFSYPYEAKIENSGDAVRNGRT